MNENQNTGGVLEALFILLASITTTLLLLWIASTLQGEGLFENLPMWFTDTVLGIKGILTAGGSAAVIYWFIRGNTQSGVYYLKGFGITTCSLIAMLFVVRELIPSVPAPIPSEPETISWNEWDLQFHYSITNSVITYFDPSQIGILQKYPRPKDKDRLKFKPIPFDYGENFFITKIEPPNTHEKFVAHARPRLAKPHPTGGFTSTPSNDYLQICFVRTDKTIDHNRPMVTLNCEDKKMGDTTGVCVTSQIDQEYAENCPTQIGSINFNLIPSAHAANGKQYNWAVRSLKTLQELPKEKQFGYTHFNITSSPISPDKEIASAKLFRYFVSVNNNKILMEGWPQGSFEYSFDATKGLDFEFAIETLNFSGADGGYENIEIIFEFLNGTGKLIKRTAPIKRKYVAIRRDSEQADVANIPLSLEDSNVQWSAKYSMPIKENKYEIFVYSSPSLGDVQRRVRNINNARLKLDDDSLIKGVIRPPLGRNPNFGVVFGLEQPNKQIQFTFNQSKADTVCKYSVDYLDKFGERKLIDKQVYRYEMQPRNPGKPKLKFCTDIS